MSFVVEKNVIPYPVNISFFRGVAVVLRTNSDANALKKFWLLEPFRDAMVIPRLPPNEIGQLNKSNWRDTVTSPSRPVTAVGVRELKRTSIRGTHNL